MAKWGWFLHFIKLKYTMPVLIFKTKTSIFRWLIPIKQFLLLDKISYNSLSCLYHFYMCFMWSSVNLDIFKDLAQVLKKFRMVYLEDLQKLGWSLTESGFGHLLSHFEDETPSATEVANFALDFDLKMIGKQCLPDNHQESGKLTGPMVLQISKIRNISAPKINPHSQTAPRNDKITTLVNFPSKV